MIISDFLELTEELEKLGDNLSSNDELNNNNEIDNQNNIRKM